jgi:hypothetical protein
LSGLDQIRNSSAPANEKIMRKMKMTNRGIVSLADLGIDIESDAR